VRIADLAIRWATQPDSSRVTLNIGPLVDRLGALPDDGTPVELEVIGTSNGKRCDSRTSAVLYEISLPLKQGVLAWELPPLPSGSSCLHVSVAGQGRMIELPEMLEPVVKP
jgi:hypothetical protein